MLVDLDRDAIPESSSTTIKTSSPLLTLEKLSGIANQWERIFGHLKKSIALRKSFADREIFTEGMKISLQRYVQTFTLLFDRRPVEFPVMPADIVAMFDEFARTTREHNSTVQRYNSVLEALEKQEGDQKSMECDEWQKLVDLFDLDVNELTQFFLAFKTL